MASPNGAMLSKVAEPETDPVERRRAIRHTTVFQVAKVSSARSQELCILRDISDTGLRAEIYCAMPVGDHVTFEMRTGHKVAGTIVWARENSIGVHFDAPISVPEVLAHCSFDDRLGRMRPPRIDCEMPALLIFERQLIDVTILNISQAGMKVLSPEPLVQGSQVTIRAATLGQRVAIVRWCANGEVGLQLAQPLTYADFAAWRVQHLKG